MQERVDLRMLRAFGYGEVHLFFTPQAIIVAAQEERIPPIFADPFQRQLAGNPDGIVLLWDGRDRLCDDPHRFELTTVMPIAALPLLSPPSHDVRYRATMRGEKLVLFTAEAIQVAVAEQRLLCDDALQLQAVLERDGIGAVIEWDGMTHRRRLEDTGIAPYLGMRTAEGYADPHGAFRPIHTVEAWCSIH